MYMFWQLILYYTEYEVTLIDFTITCQYNFISSKFWITDCCIFSFLVLYGEPITVEELQNIHPNFEASTMVNQDTNLGVEPLNLFEDLPEEEAY